LRPLEAIFIADGELVHGVLPVMRGAVPVGGDVTQRQPITFDQAWRQHATTVGNFWPHAPAAKASNSTSAASALAAVRIGLIAADEAVMLIDSAFERGDSFTTARALAAAIAKIGNVDLVLAGRQAADGDCGVVGLGFAELLELPAITFAMNIEFAGQTLVVERALVDGSETVETAMPAVVTVSHEVGKVRQANLRETMKAARKPVTIWAAADLGLTASEVAQAASAAPSSDCMPRAAKCSARGSQREDLVSRSMARYFRPISLMTCRYFSDSVLTNAAN